MKILLKILNLFKKNRKFILSTSIFNLKIINNSIQDKASYFRSNYFKQTSKYSRRVGVVKISKPEDKYADKNEFSTLTEKDFKKRSIHNLRFSIQFEGQKEPYYDLVLFETKKRMLLHCKNLDDLLPFIEINSEIQNKQIKNIQAKINRNNLFLFSQFNGLEYEIFNNTIFATLKEIKFFDYDNKIFQSKNLESLDKIIYIQEHFKKFLLNKEDQSEDELLKMQKIDQTFDELKELDEKKKKINK